MKDAYIWTVFNDEIEMEVDTYAGGYPRIIQQLFSTENFDALHQVRSILRWCLMLQRKFVGYLLQVISIIQTNRMKRKQSRDYAYISERR